MSKKKHKNQKNITKKLRRAAQNAESYQPTLGEPSHGVELFLLLPVIFFMTLYLFCVRVRFVSSNINNQFWYVGEEPVGGFYDYFRMQVFLVVIIIFAVFLLAFLLMGYVKVIRHRVYIPMLVFVVTAFLSYVFSQYKEIARIGYIDRYEGTAVLICYMILLFYVMHVVRREEQVNLTMNCFTVACVLLGIWGILETFGYYLGDLPTWLYVPLDMLDSTAASESAPDAYCNWFFSNINYLSFFLIFPICLFAMACIQQRDTVKKCGYAALTGLMLYCLWHAASLSGMVALVVSVCVALITAGSKNLMKWRKSLGLLLLTAAVSVGTSLPVITGQLQTTGLFSRLPGVEEVYAEEAAPSFTSTTPLVFTEIDSIVTDGPNVTFDFDGKEVIIATEDEKLKSVTDDAGNPLPADNGLLNVSTYVDEGVGYTFLQVQTAAYTWRFGIVDGELLFTSPSGQGIKLDKVEHFGFEGHEGFGSGRGYIWSRTLPLLKDTLLLGYGADTYALAFPQDDYAGKYSHLHDTIIIVDKPHNMYLGSAVNTGVVSMLALMAIYGIYLVESIRIYRRRDFEGYMDYIGMGIFLAVAGFVVAGLVNDSTVQVMPVVYTFLGMGFAINRMISKNEEPPQFE